MNPLNAYKETKIRTANSGKLIVMLYDEALRQMDIAIDLLKRNSKQMDSVNNSIIKAQDIITELMVSLDFDKGGDVATNLFSLYVFFNQQLIQANINKNHNVIKTIRGQMAELRSAWVQIINKSNIEKDSSSGGINIAG